MEERKNYFYIFQIALIPFFIGLITKKMILAFVTLTAVIGIVLSVQIKRGYVWDWKWREWLGRKDSPVIYWIVIGIEAFVFLKSLLFLKDSIAFIYQ